MSRIGYPPVDRRPNVICYCTACGMHDSRTHTCRIDRDTCCSRQTKPLKPNA